MATLLELPRELYLDICALLSPKHLANLSGVSKDHYLAAQQPLYNHIRLTRYRSLVRLTETLAKQPVVSSISKEQRIRWFKLTDAQLLERNIKTLNLTLDKAKDGDRITGAVLSNCLGALARKCWSVKISLTLHGGWPGWQRHLDEFPMNNVIDLILFLGTESEFDPATASQAGARLWDLAFSGNCFPDLKRVYINTSADDPVEIPQDLNQSVGTAHLIRARSEWEPVEKPADTTILFGLRKMEAITLAHTTRLTVDTMTSLFASNIIPTRLTKLEIVDCPKLHPLRHLSEICILLQRALQLVKHLKLHLCRSPHGETELDAQYGARIEENPEEHPCDIVRQLGDMIPHLDIAMPFVCTDILPPACRKTTARKSAYYGHEMALPTVPFEPYHSLSERVAEADLKYRRVICWKDVCGYKYPWHELVETVEGMGMAGDRSEMSWEFLHQYEEKGVWKVEGCLPVELVNKEMLKKPLGGGAI